MRIRSLCVLGALTAALPVVASAAPENTVEARLSAAVRAMGPAQRTTLRRRMLAQPVAGDEQVVRGALNANALSALRAQHAKPRDTMTSDPSIARRYVRKLDALCRTLPADARRGAGLPDTSCTALRARATSNAIR